MCTTLHTLNPSASGVDALREVHNAHTAGAFRAKAQHPNHRTGIARVKHVAGSGSSITKPVANNLPDNLDCSMHGVHVPAGCHRLA